MNQRSISILALLALLGCGDDPAPTDAPADPPPAPRSPTAPANPANPAVPAAPAGPATDASGTAIGTGAALGPLGQPIIPVPHAQVEAQVCRWPWADRSVAFSMQTSQLPGPAFPGRFALDTGAVTLEAPASEDNSGQENSDQGAIVGAMEPVLASLFQALLMHRSGFLPEGTPDPAPGQQMGEEVAVPVELAQTRVLYRLAPESFRPLGWAVPSRGGISTQSVTRWGNAPSGCSWLAQLRSWHDGAPIMTMDIGWAEFEGSHFPERVELSQPDEPSVLIQLGDLRLE